MIYTNLDGVHYRVRSGEIGDLHNNLSTIRGDIIRMKMSHLGNQKWFHRKDKWDIKEVNGEVFVDVYGAEEEEVEEREEVIEEQTDTIDKYCLLVEVGNWQDYDRPPIGFAIFVPSDDGHEPRSGTTPNLTFAGYTTAMIENDPELHDPLGNIEQETYRPMWCKKGNIELEFLPKSVEQLKRVDGGWLAYDGDEELEEITQLYVEGNVWTYEGLNVYYWEYAEPGPPPEATCGYTWALPGSAEAEEADHTGVRYLFYMIAHPSGKYVYHWPREFHQQTHEINQWWENTMIYRAPDVNFEGWMDNATYDNGFLSTLTSIMFPEGWSKRLTYEDAYVTYWGVIYGDYYTPLSDYTDPSYDYQFLKAEKKDSYLAKTWDNEGKSFSTNGIYVAGERWSELFLQGLTLYPSGSLFWRESFINIEERGEQLEEDRFITTSDPLNDRELVLIQGNSDAYEWTGGSTPPPYPGQEARHMTYTEVEWNGGIISVLAGGDIFYIVPVDVFGSYTYYYAGGYHTVPYYTHTTFYDYGIFTKPGTGVDEDNVVTPDTIEPIYAYSTSLFDEVTIASSYYNNRAIYGIIIDGLHYRTEEFTRISPDGYAPAKYDIGEDFYDDEGNQIYCTNKVRAGVIRTNITSTRRR